MVPDVPVDAVLGRGLPQVGEDAVAVRDRRVGAPRPELVAERVQVGVGPHPRVPEQVPGPAGRAARLKDRVAPLRMIPLQVVGGADPGDAGTDDEHVNGLVVPGGRFHGHHRPRRAWATGGDGGNQSGVLEI